MPLLPRLLCALALARPAVAEWTGLLGFSFASDEKVEQRQVHCPTGFITGLSVRHGRDHKDDVDTYDFRIRCNKRWGPWSGMSFKAMKEEKEFVCPMEMHLTGLEVAKGRREFGDVDTYDFKLQCSGVWQSYLGMEMVGTKQRASRECPSGTIAWGWKALRGFVKKGDQDNYEFELNCKPAADAKTAVRKMPNLSELGLHQNVFTWSTQDVGKWLKAIGLQEYQTAFEENHLQGDVIFLLLESHLQDMGMYKIGDRLYFMEELTQLHDATNQWSKMLNIQLTSSRTLPNLRRAGLPLQVVSWSVREVSRWVEALGLKEWVQTFQAHRIQGDVMFSLKEETLKEMGVARIGDRLYLADCLQSLYEELTAWKKKQQTVQATVDPTRMLGNGDARAEAAYAAKPAGYGAGAGASGGGANARVNAVLKGLLQQGYSMQEVLALVKSRPELRAQLGL